MKVKTHEHLQGWNKEDLIVIIKLQDQNITWMRKEIKMLKKEIKILKEESKNNMSKTNEQCKDGLKTVLKFFSAKDQKECERNLYKYTSCGAWIFFHDWGITLGSIVEGSDNGTNHYKLEYSEGFSDLAIQMAIDEIEKEADLIWNWANKEDEDGKTDAEKGFDFPYR